MQVSAAIKQAVEAKITECLTKATQRYKCTFQRPTVSYDKSGTVAGTANYTTWHVQFNPVLLMENQAEFIAQTVPHEIAHLITDRVYPHAHRPTGGWFTGAKRSVHGTEWQSVMRVLGADPRRCHQYDVSSAQTKVKNKYHYTCKCNGDKANHFVGPKVHAKVQAGARYTCRNCRAAIVLVQAVGKLTYQQAREAVKTPVAPKPKATPVAAKPAVAGSKFEQCLAVYKSNAHLERSEIAALFVKQVGMTPAGANTYYYKCKALEQNG